MAASTSTSKSPIRVGIIGLSASAVTSWASAAHLPYLLSPRGRALFEITALLNSSAEAAAAAISTYNLDPARVKAYGDPSTLAADTDVDLVVCVTRVDKHYTTVLPSVAAGKAVFVEWPLAESADKARELALLAGKHGGESLVGLQGRLAPVVKKVREVIESGRIGKVLSVEVRAAGGTMDREVLSLGLEYFSKLEVGGNHITIGFGHIWDFVQSAFGEASTSSLHGHAQLQRPEIPLRDPATNTIVRTTTSTVPDLLHATATLTGSSSTVTPGASLAFTFRRGQPYPGDMPLVWTVHGEKGELRVRSPGGTALHADAYSNGANVTVEVHDFASGNVSEVEWGWEPWQEELPVVARSVAAVYEKFAKGVDNGGKRGWVDFDEAVVRHEQLDKLLEGWKGV